MTLTEEYLKENLITAYFIDNERKNIEVLSTSEDKKTTLSTIIPYDENFVSFKSLIKFINIDQLHELTYKKNKESRELFEKKVIEIAQRDGLIRKIDRITSDIFPLLVKAIFEDENDDHLFALKLSLFELDKIKNSTNEEVKVKLRKAKTKVEVLQAAFELNKHQTVAASTSVTAFPTEATTVELSTAAVTGGNLTSINDTRLLEKYFYKTSFQSPIVDYFLENLEKFIWTSRSRKTQWEVLDLDQSLISLDPFLAEIHKDFKGRLNFFKFPPKSNYIWHRDGLNQFNINLILKKQNSVTIFEKEEDYVSDDFHNALKPILVLDYEPKYWYLFNAQINHTIFNLSTETRYLITYNVLKSSNIDYSTALDKIKKLV